MDNQSIITIIDSKSFSYPQADSFFRPSEKYPELVALGYPIASTQNTVYEAVRKALYYLGLDKENYNTPEWNPLKEIIKPGDSVLIKPNLVMDKNINHKGGTECLYTQPGVIAPIIDYIILAQNGEGKIVVGDAPMQECVFNNILESGYETLIQFYKDKGINIEIVDFRELTSVVKSGVHISTINKNASGTVINLGKESEFCTTDVEAFKRMRITNYDPRILNTHHNQEKQEYYVSDYVLKADVIINMPKPKSHRKAGATIALKNCVGINTRKEFLPHHTMGAKQDGGDEYEKKSRIHAVRSMLLDKLNIASADKQYNRAKILRMIVRFLSIMLKLEGTPNSEGSWWGNDTISRTIADLNKIVFYADKNGVIRTEKCRKMLIIADMIISGDEEGPVAPTPKKVGYIAAGTNPVCFDEAISALMGFDYKKIPSITRSRTVKSNLKIVSNNERPIIVSDVEQYNLKTPEELDRSSSLCFRATSGWKGHIEK